MVEYFIIMEFVLLVDGNKLLIDNFSPFRNKMLQYCSI